MHSARESRGKNAVPLNAAAADLRLRFLTLGNRVSGWRRRPGYSDGREG
ncbi:hypothetical protein [Pseudarthrobacter sp. SSS035]|nr:hypothetical protein [Pseudarthrobacter sp. SSS035]